MILDINAGNQTMWYYKASGRVIHIDMEKKLEVKPTIFCDNTQTPFRDGAFTTIYADPPHFFGHHNSLYSIPDRATFRKVYPNETGIPRYYGADKYKNQLDLLRYIVRLLNECYRILSDDGVLWFKWNETNISVNTLKPLLEKWDILLMIKVRLNNPNKTEKQTYWLSMIKKEKCAKQATLF